MIWLKIVETRYSRWVIPKTFSGYICYYAVVLSVAIRLVHVEDMNLWYDFMKSYDKFTFRILNESWTLSLDRSDQIDFSQMNRVQFYQTFVSIWQINPTDLSQIKFKSESTTHKNTINMFHLPESLFHYRTSIQKSCNAKEERQHGGCFLSTNLNCPTIQPNATTI